MLKSQKIQLRMSELRERINSMEPTKPSDPEFLKGRADLAAMEVEYRQAIEEEDTYTGAASFGGEDSSEHREALQVTRKADLGVWWELWYPSGLYIQGAQKPKRRMPGDSPETTSR